MNTTLLKALSGEPTIDPSLRLYIPFNEGNGNLAKDYSQYSNNGVLTDVEWGINGGVFNGTSAYADCDNDTSLDITDAITIGAWLKAGDLSTKITIFCRGGAEVDGYFFIIDPDGHLYFKTNQLGGTQETYTAAGEIIIDTWYYLVVTRSGTTAKIYKNSNDITSVSGSHLDPVSNNKNAFVGMYNYQAGLFHFNGTIACVKIYNCALSALEILNTYETERGAYGV